MPDPLHNPTLPPDVYDACHGHRLDHYLEQFGGKPDGTPERNRRRGEVYDLAHQAATAEMLDEIHLMLRTLLMEDKR
jgi:hypothetical protein